MRQEGRAPFVGRERQLAEIDRALGRARAGISALVTILGEGGIGKTRLAEEVVARAEGFTVAWGAGWPDAGSPPLWPWQAVLDQLGAAGAAELLDQQEATTDPERFARFRAVSEAVAGIAAAGPVCVVLDDCHHVDAGALLLARFLVRTLRNSPLLVVVGSRPTAGPLVDTLTEVAREGVRLDLEGLDVDAVVALISATGTLASDALGATLQALTNGNPFLLQEALSGSGSDLAIVERAGRQFGERMRVFDPPSVLALAAGALLGPGAEPATVATVAGVAPSDVLGAHDRAVDEGVLRPPPAAARFTFVHDLLREALLERVGAPEAAALQARAADALATAATPAPHSPDRAARIARLRLAAATSGDSDAVAAAVSACRAAARVDMEGLAYEAAAGVLAEACALLERTGAAPPADLLVERARAELAGGHLSAARASFLAAVERPVGDIEPEVLADAAIGLGGIWVAEHRAVDDRDRFHRLLERAAKELGDGSPSLRIRLDVRIAAEALYAGTNDTIDDMAAALAAARALGDPIALAEALSLYHHVILGPAFADGRLAVANELIEVASAAGDAVLTLMGVMWRTVDLFLGGDPGAEQSLLELRQRADALRVDAVLFVVELLDVMRALRAGRVAEAESAAGRALEHGLAVGDADAINYYAAHLLAIRWLQGRSDEVLPLARDSVDGSPMVAGDHSFSAALAALAADVGGPALEEAQRELDRFTHIGLDTLPPSSNWLVTMFCLVEAAAAAGDTAVAAAAYDLLLPYDDLPVLASIGVACFGPVARSLGKAARTMGRVDDAVRHLEHAEEVARRIGNRPLVAVTRADLASTLLERGAPGDEARAVELLGEAESALRRLGLDARADRIAAELDTRSTPAPAAPAAARCALVGGAWDIEAGAERARIPDGVGMQHLARLLAAPGVDFRADELAGVAVAAAHQEVLDDAARDAYRARIAELQAAAEAADRKGDVARSAAVQRELDELLDHLAGSTGLGGRARAFADAQERARTSVQKAIRRSLAALAAQAPVVAEQLERSIRTGRVCRFDPVDGAPSSWVVVGAPAA